MVLLRRGRTMNIEDKAYILKGLYGILRITRKDEVKRIDERVWKIIDRVDKL